MDPRETAPVMPGCLAWFALAGVFLLSGEWIDSVTKARGHPSLLILLAVATVACAIWMSTRAERNLWLAVPLALFACVAASALLLAGVFGLLHITVMEFAALGRSFTLGSAIVVLLPIAFLIMIGISTVFGLALLVFRRGKN